MTNDFPAHLAEKNNVQPVPRRIRAYVAGRAVLDTVEARYVFETPFFPQFYIPAADVTEEFLIRTGVTKQSPRGTVEVVALQLEGERRDDAGQLHLDDTTCGIKDTIRFDWAALDAWFEEDEEVFVHPRSPYARVDALRSTRTVRVEVNGIVLAESLSPVMVFETGLPTRYYLNRTDVDFSLLRDNDTKSQCPYKGLQSGGWDAVRGGTVVEDVAWAYDFPTTALAPIKGLICFYNEKVDILVDGQPQPRPAPPSF